MTARYPGDSNFTGSTSSVVTINAKGIATTTTLASSANPSVYAQSVTFTATIKPASGTGTPTGTVTFYDGSTVLGMGTLSSKKASLTVSSLPVSSQAITAVYSGDANYAPSTSAVLSQTVNQDATTTKITSSANPSVYGQSVTFMATVSVNSPGAGTPTGMITFYSGTTLLGTGKLSGETASFTTTSPLAAGNRTIKATYSGDTNDKTSSGTLTQTVNQDSTTTSVVSSMNTSAYGQSVTFTATVSANAPGSGTPAGSVTFMDGSTKLATVALKNGAALYSTAKLPTGLDTITATYNASSSFTTSNESLNQTVNQDATSATVASSLNPSVYGQAVTFTATVSASTPGSGTPTGTVMFYDGSAASGRPLSVAVRRRPSRPRLSLPARTRSPWLTGAIPTSR